MRVSGCAGHRNKTARVFGRIVTFVVGGSAAGFERARKCFSAFEEESYINHGKRRAHQTDQQFHQESKQLSSLRRWRW